MENLIGSTGRIINWDKPLPHYVVAMHRLTRLGKDTSHAGSQNQFVEFDLTSEEGQVLKSKFPDLIDAERVMFIYSDERRYRICL